MKKMIAVILLLCMALSLCACNPGSTVDTQPQETTQPTQESTEATQTSTEEDNAFYVRVVDSEGNGIAGAVVQLCKLGGDGSCTPGATNAQGEAKFSVPKEEYKVSFVVMPAGYTYSGEDQEFYFDKGVNELIIVLKKA